MAENERKQSDGERRRRGRGVGGRVLDLFSSVRFGIVQMVVLFVYCTVGSVGVVYPVSLGLWDASSWRHVMPRQYPVFEMTEFEWFHTPFFVGLCVLICVTIAVTTLRRIPLRVVNLGVWMIHSGIIMLTVGSIWYFGTKVEGDTPVFRRAVHIEVPGGGVAEMPAVEGASVEVRSASGWYRFMVAQVDPAWPLLTGEDAGKRTLAVTVQVESPVREELFMRQLLAGYPQYTEDVIPGRGRAVKLEEYGTKLIDDSLAMSLEPMEQDRFWLKDSSALAVREARADRVAGEWRVASIEALPRYNDRLGSVESAWNATRASVRPIDIGVSWEDEGLVDGVDVRVVGYLRYAVPEGRLAPGGPEVNPVIDVSVAGPGGQQVRRQLAAFDPARRTAFDGLISFEHVENEERLAALEDAASSALIIEAGDGGRLELALDSGGVDWNEWIDVGDAGWRVRVAKVVRDLIVRTGRFSLAIVDVRTPDGGSFRRWVFEDESLTRDLSGDGADAHSGMPGGDQTPDPRLRTVFRAGQSSALVIAGGPADVGLHLLTRGEDGRYERQGVEVGERVMFGGGASLTIASYSETARVDVRPWIVPEEMRDRDTDTSRAYAMIQVEVSAGSWSERRWLEFNRYSFPDTNYTAPGLGRLSPERFVLPGGRAIELIYTRQSMALGSAVVLDDFILTAHAGGYTGEMASVRDWTSVLLFREGDGEGGRWSEPVEVRSNQPGEYGGLRYFQAFWDAPRRAGSAAGRSGGMAFTGLGVGNREGVHLQLAGSALSVMGMLYAFYVKPIIKRRRRDRVLATLAEARTAPVEESVEDDVDDAVEEMAAGGVL